MYARYWSKGSSRAVKSFLFELLILTNHKSINFRVNTVASFLGKKKREGATLLNLEETTKALV